MWQVSSAWLAALSVPHSRTTRMEAWYGGQLVGSVQVESGSVQVTARNRVRRTLNAVVPESAWPLTSTDLLAPYGQRVNVYQSIVATGGVNLGEVPVFAGRVELVERVRKSGKVQVTALDGFADVNDAQFEQSYAPSPGLRVTATIGRLIHDVHPEAVIQDQTGSTATVPTGTMWDTDRGQAVDDLAASIGAEVICLPDGVTWVIRPVPTLSGTPVWTLADGQGGTMVRDAQSKSRRDVANRWIVHVERPGAAPFTVTVTDDDPSSPTRYGGPYGRVVRHLRSPLITDAAQAMVAGRARLARSIGLTRTRDLDHVPNPALEAGDVITVQASEGSETHIADSFALPLAVTDVMTTNTRSTQV